ncbi:olfactory receptor 6N1-like [Rhinoderma darwinii]|uniref:olfactory receptor 6N1-like n=1 Tax=Rhinoderma darwinii TaxID=43563 RepID=UPI003F66E351
MTAAGRRFSSGPSVLATLRLIKWQLKDTRRAVTWCFQGNIQCPKQQTLCAENLLNLIVERSKTWSYLSMWTLYKNHTWFEDFHLQGFSNIEDYSIGLFFIFLFTYLLTLSGNMIIVLVVRLHLQLHTPMYFFITNLSLLEIWYISTTVPKLLAILVTNDKRVSFHWCFAQLYMFHGLGMTECGLLAVMSFDRYMAICNPLRYTSIMNDRMCGQLALLCWIYGFVAATIPLSFTIRVPFCGLRSIDHYFCDLAPLLNLACINTSLNNSVNGLVIGFATMFNFIFIIIMYINIIYSIMRMKTNTGRIRVFSTCSSHITVVMLFYSTAFTVYASPKGLHSVDYDKLFALVYAMFTPLLNPIIYSLRNKEVKTALKRMTDAVKTKLTKKCRNRCFLPI